MKRVDLVAPPMAGHLHPVLGIAARLAAEPGLSVRVISTAAALPAIRASGLTGRALLDGADEVIETVVNPPYRIGSNSNWTAGEIVNQIKLTKAAPETRGAIYFSFKSLRNDLGGVQEALLKNSYRQDAIIPASPWIKAKPPKSPKVKVDRDEKFVRASWTETGDVKAFLFVVYANDKNGWSYSVVPASEKSIALSADRKIEQIVVKSVDRLGNESR